MYLRKDQYPILIFVFLTMIGYGIYYSIAKNYEFIFYIVVILFFFFLILATNRKVGYSNLTLWGLAIWSLLHMSGGCLPVKGDVLYKLILIPITDNIFRFDQFVHIFGFAVATLMMYEVIKPRLKPNPDKWTAISIVVVMAGLGVGAVNEIVEFAATIIAALFNAETGVGGYVNTSLDLVSDLVGAVIAMVVIWWKKL